MADISEALRNDLQDREFAEGYAESFLDTYVATQIKVLREQRELTQKQLANELGTSQGVISRIEDAGYASWNVKTLKKLARVFDVRLKISFETYGSLIGEMKRFSRKSLERVRRSDDPFLSGSDAHLRSAKLNAGQLTLFTGAQLRHENARVLRTTSPVGGSSSAIPKLASSKNARVYDFVRKYKEKASDAGQNRNVLGDNSYPGDVMKIGGVR